MLRVRKYEVPGGQPDERGKGAILTERDVIKEHARHFLHRVEDIISIH